MIRLHFANKELICTIREAELNTPVVNLYWQEGLEVSEAVQHTSTTYPLHRRI